VNEEVPHAFLAEVNATGRDYGMLLSPRSGEQPDDRTFQEQYAFYYDRSVIEAITTGSLQDDSMNDWFVREPYFARFAVVSSGFTFVAITVHTQPDNALAEITRLADVMQAMRATFSDEDDFILLGDLNAGCSYASADQLDALTFRSAEYHWIVPDEADTNLASSQCAYDRIVVTASTLPNYAGKWGVDASFVDTMVSDHWPVWTDFWASERGP